MKQARVSGIRLATESSLPTRPGAEDDTSLTDKQRRFVSEYLIDLNASAAAIRAGFSANSADAIGWENLRKPAISEAIKAGKAAQILAEAGLTAARVLEELRRVAFANVRDYWATDGSAKHPNALTVEQGAALAGFEVLIKNAKAGDGVTDTIYKFKLWDKVRALELLAKHVALLTDIVRVDSPAAQIAALLAGRQRAAECKLLAEGQP